MNRKSLKIALAVGLAASIALPAAAQTQPPAQSQAHAGRYSVSETPVGTLLDDPAAAAILKQLIPTVYANDMFQTMGRTQTLKAIQQYEPVELSDEKLARIQAELDKLHGS
ncbi:MAG: hypothetical protein RLZZ08_745 [Pseudomonadota bacterium]